MNPVILLVPAKLMNTSFLSLAVLLLMPMAAAFAHQSPMTQPPSPAPLSAEDRLKEIDALLAEVRPMAAQLEERCLADFSLDKVAGDQTAFPINGTTPPILGMIGSIRHYYECEAFTKRNPGFCAKLPRYQPTNQPDDYEARCRTSYVRSRVIQFNVAGRADAAKVCETLPFSADDLRGTSVREECAWMTNREPDAHCKNPIAPTLDVIDVKDCLAHHVLHADENNCSLIKDAPIAQFTRTIYEGRCRDAAAYRRAYQAKDAGRCDDSLVCRMLMGEDVCGRHLDNFRKNFCLFKTQETALGSDDASREHRARAKAIFARLGRLLAAFEPKSQPGYDARYGDYMSLLKEFDQSSKMRADFSMRAPSRYSETPD